MKTYAWDPKKNEQLQKERRISFEEIVFHLEIDGAIDNYEHPNQTRYPGQRILVVFVESYAYLVPYVEHDVEVFLKTIIPSRKATKEYIGETHDQTG